MTKTSSRSRFVVDGSPIEFRAGETMLEAMLGAGCHPTGGGCLCTAGDCPHCLATVDGVGYVRTCQRPARSGAVVVRDHRRVVVQSGEPRSAVPPLPLDAPVLDHDTSTLPVRYLSCDVLVIGLGDSGRAALAEAESRGKSVLAFDDRGYDDLEDVSGQLRGEVIGIYPGPLVVARTRSGMVHAHVHEEIVVATGGAEVQPVAPGSDLSGIVTARAAERLTKAGIDLGRVVVLGTPPDGVDGTVASGTLVRFEQSSPGDGRLSAVVVASDDGSEQRHECDTVSVGLGLQPRDALLRMASGLGGRVRVRAVGDAARAADLPPCPQRGIVCPCSGISVQDLDDVWQRGFREMELVKRATLAGTGTCQGSVCLPYLRSFLADRGGELQPPFTARPLARQQTLGELAAGAYHHATPRTTLDAEHRRLGAQMERAGGWFRPWSYGPPDEEYWAVREAVSVCDVSTLGKMSLSGPDALELLEHLYPTRVSTLEPGRSRYVLLLDERGYVLDDGLICREPERGTGARFFLTFTSGGATLGELWLRDWAESLGLDVRLMNQTMSLGAINVTGPRAAELLERAGAGSLPAFGAHAKATVAGVECRILRLSFTGELSYELHHAALQSPLLWRRLLDLGADLGCKPHGLETLLRLRLEKGHIVVGQDTDYDSTPRRIQHQWAVKLDKHDFVGKLSLERTDRVPLDRCLVGLEMESPAPIEGAVIWHDGNYAGYVTSSTDSPVLGKAVMLGWVAIRGDRGTLPEEVLIDGRAAKRVALPFYDPDNRRPRVAVVSQAASPGASSRSLKGVAAEPDPDEESEPSPCTRIVATEQAIDQTVKVLPRSTVALRTAPDELLVLGVVSADQVPDPCAIVEPETGFARIDLPAAEAALVLEATCEWQLPSERPAFAQGAVADLPVKLWLEDDRVSFFVARPFARDLEDRLERAAFGSSFGARP